MTSDLSLTEFRVFKGHLVLETSSYALNFRARIDLSGEVELDLGKFALNQDTDFISQGWDKPGHAFTKFSISGTAEDGTQFTTDDLHFTTLGESWSQTEGETLAPISSCSTGRFKRQLTKRAEAPTLRTLIKGFRSMKGLVAETASGTITMAGPAKLPELNHVTGYIALQARDTPADLAAWHMQGDALLEHVRRVMSFASASILRAPVQEMYFGEDVNVTCWSQTEQAGALLRVFHYIDQQPIFDAAVSSFFHPPVDLKNLFFAIEWFTMDATYNEVRLINAMTSLENMVDSNLNESDVLIQPKNEFEKTKRELRKTIRDCVAKWQPEAAEEALGEFYGKLADLNRRPLLRKLELLAQRWQVPLQGIDEKSIRAAKQARDRVVHRGQYYGDARKDDSDLWTHVTVVREIATRFLLTAIGYRGYYLSYVGGCHRAEFPPKG